MSCDDYRKMAHQWRTKGLKRLHSSFKKKKIYDLNVSRANF